MKSKTTKTKNLKQSILNTLALAMVFWGYSITNLFGQVSQTFTSTSTFTVPAGVTTLTVECWGAGGGAGGAATTANAGGAGGGGGAYSKSTTIAVTPGNTYTVTVGTGGPGGSGAAAGTAGADSWFNSSAIILAKGGAGGAANNGTGGAGGTTAASIGTTKFAGGAGANGASATGGGGGGGAGTANPGGAGSGITAGAGGLTGGGAGAAGSTANANNTNLATAPGGGGGAPRTGAGGAARSGSAGANGQVIITYTAPACSGTPAPGNTLANGTSGSITLACGGGSVSLTLQNATGSGATYNWQSSSNGISYTNTGITTNSYSPTVTTTTYYRCVVTCAGSPGTSTPVVVNVPTCINMSNGSTTTCNANFYDSGGPSGNFANNQNFTYTFFPNSGNRIQAVFSAFSTEDLYDGLLIYNGPTTSSPLISSGLPAGNNTTTAPAGSFYGLVSPGTVASTDVTGALTFVFQSDVSGVSTCWAAIISCIAVPPCSGTPTPGNTLSTTTTACSGSNFTLSLQNATSGSGITYQWQSSATGVGGTYANIGGATSTTYTTSITSSSFYRCLVSCSAGGTGISNPVQINVVTCINMSNGSSTTCSANFFDSGGPASNYVDNESYTYTINPTVGNGIQVTFNSFAIETCCDGLTIYNGPNTSSPSLGTFTTIAPGTQFTSTHASGALTFVFTSDLSINFSGWDATVSCISGCSGTPAAGTASSSASSICGSGTTTLSLAGATIAPGINYQWQQSINGGGYTNISGATTSTYTTGTLSTSGTYTFRCVVTCSNSGLSATSSATSAVSVFAPAALSTSTISLCAGNSASVTATPAGATSYQWSGGSTATTATISVTTAGTYSCTVTQGSCVTTASATAAVSALPLISSATATPSTGSMRRADGLSNAISHRRPQRCCKRPKHSTRPNH